jgi:hypothetical protein
MKTEQVTQVTDQALGQLINALEQGKSATLTRYLAAMARFHRYSFHNVMLIYTQKDDASNVAGFHAWRKLGRFVKKGEKGILILARMIFVWCPTLQDGYIATSAWCPPTVTKFISISREGEDWRVVVRNRWDQEVILSPKFDVVSTRRLPGPANK